MPDSLETNRNVGVRSDVRRGPSTRGFAGRGAADAAAAHVAAPRSATTKTLIPGYILPACARLLARTPFRCGWQLDYFFSSLSQALGPPASWVTGTQQRERKFSASLWRHPAGYCTKSPRGRIVEDLVTHRLRPGIEMDRVRSLLGSPDLMTADDVWFYYVSAEHNGFLATCVGLQLNSTNERLQKAFVTRDD
jgi:hypothetical protein